MIEPTRGDGGLILRCDNPSCRAFGGASVGVEAEELLGQALLRGWDVIGREQLCPVCAAAAKVMEPVIGGEGGNA